MLHVKGYRILCRGYIIMAEQGMDGCLSSTLRSDRVNGYIDIRRESTDCWALVGYLGLQDKSLSKWKSSCVEVVLGLPVGISYVGENQQVAGHL